MPFTSRTAQAATTPVANCSAAPAAATQVGYCTETLATDGFTTSNVDMKSTNAPSQTTNFQWRPYNCNGVKPSTANIAISSDGVIQVGLGGASYGPTLTTIGCYYAGNGATKFVGEAFGGGAYIEASVRIVNPHSNPSTHFWPCWWAVSLEDMIGTAQWPNQTNPHLVGYPELDIMEYFEGKWNNALNAFQQTSSLWSGYNTGTLTNSPVWKTTFGPNTAYFNGWHNYAVRWTPATSTKSGMLDFYLDGVLTFSRTYSAVTTQTAPVVNSSWIVGVMDRQHLVLFLSSSNDSPLRVDHVHVWQKSTAANLVN